MFYKSEALSMQQGDTKTLQLAFLKDRGPRGGRNVINRMVIAIDVQVDTNAATTIAAGGWAAFLKRLRVWDAQGDIVNLTGPEIRALHIYQQGRAAVADPTNLAISQSNATRTIYLVVDFAPPRRARRRWDFALPVDQLKVGGGIEITSASAADIGTGGGTTIDSQTFTVYFTCREDADFQGYSRRELRSLTQQNTNDLYIPVNGGLLRNAFLFKAADHISGGTSQDATVVSVEALDYNRISPSLLRNFYQQEGDNDPASTGDPFIVATRAVPLVWTRYDGKITDCVRHAGQMLVRLESSTVTNNVIVYELITKQTEQSTLSTRMLAAEAGATAVSVKSDGKTKREPASWGPLAAFMPKKYRRGA